MTEISRKLASFGQLEGFGLEINGEVRQIKPSILEGNLAEREGFEPPVRFPVHLISSYSDTAARINKRQEKAGESEFQSPFGLSAFCFFYQSNWAKIGINHWTTLYP